MWLCRIERRRKNNFKKEQKLALAVVVTHFGLLVQMQSICQTKKKKFTCSCNAYDIISSSNVSFVDTILLVLKLKSLQFVFFGNERKCNFFSYCYIIMSCYDELPE